MKDMKPASIIGQKIAANLKDKLISQFPGRHFRIYISGTLHDSLIIRFHQVWENEVPYVSDEYIPSYNHAKQFFIVDDFYTSN
jgi:hypothetical protein